MQDNDWLMKVAPRDHFKSASFYADFMWRLMFGCFENKEYHYFSYQDSMAAYHISKIKALVKNNPYYENCVDLKPTAESVIKYSWDYIGRKEASTYLTMEPHGLLAFKRGIHCDGVYVDDPLQDPDNKLILTKIYKVNDIIKTQILDMPREFCKIIGTPQTNQDFFFDVEMRKKFAVRIQPAEVDPVKKIALWPEHMNWDELQSRKALRGQKIYNQEYNVSPIYAENSYFNEDEINAVVNKDLQALSIFDKIKSPERIDTIAGWDLGKKRHPAHFTVFQIKNIGGKKRATQIHQKFFDHWDYAGENDNAYNVDKPTQLSYVKQAIDYFNIDFVETDNTRGELTTLQERGELPKQIELLTMTSKDKWAMATDFGKAVSEKFIELIDDPRMVRQILCVTNELEAVEGPEGHGDSFWSIAMCFKRMKLSVEKIGDYFDENDLGDSEVYGRAF